MGKLDRAWHWCMVLVHGMHGLVYCLDGGVVGLVRLGTWALGFGSGSGVW